MGGGGAIKYYLMLITNYFDSNIVPLALSPHQLFFAIKYKRNALLLVSFINL